MTPWVLRTCSVIRAARPSTGAVSILTSEQIEQRYGQAPQEYLADGGFSTLDDIEKVSTPERGTKV